MRREISSIIKEWKEEARVKGIVMVSPYSDTRDTIEIYTDKPGYMIGYRGNLYDKYKEKLKAYNPHLEHITIKETDSWYIR